MLKQREVLRSGVGMTFNQTWEYDLPKNGFLSSLTLYVRSTENASPFATARKWRLLDYISKIEVIGDGSEIIKSFDGRQAVASAFYDDFQVPASMWRTYSNTPHRQFIPIHFGRRYWDQKYGLDLSRWNQVTVKVTNDATSTEFTTDVDIDVVADWFRETANPFQGYFREEEWKTWAPVAAAWEYNELPTGLPIRRILLRGRPGVDTADALNNSSMDRLMHDIEFTIRTGQTRLYRGDLFTLALIGMMEFPGRAETMAMSYRTANYGLEMGVGYVTNALAAVATYTDAPATVPVSLKVPDVQDSAQQVQTYAGDAPLEWLVRGAGFMNNVPLYYARADDMSDILDPAPVKDVKVDIQCQTGTTVSGTSAAAENGIILSRLVR